MTQDEDLLTESFSARRKCFAVFQKITVASNLIFALFALLLVVLGAISVKALNQFSFFTKVSIPAGLIVLGILLLFIIFLGLYGSFRKSTKFLAAYFVLLFFFIICEFGVGGGSYHLRASIPSELEYSWSRLDDNDRNNVQWDFGCCGWYNGTDFPGSKCNTTSNSTHHTNLTRSEGNLRDILQQNENSSHYNFTIPCEGLLVAYFDKQLYAVGTVGVVFASLQLLALISSIIVFGFIKVEQRRSQDERF
jgi:energy-converting hydrogenase Eha subunit A